MATTDAAKQGVKTLAAQIRGVFAGLDGFAAWADDLEARETTMAASGAAVAALTKERTNLQAEIRDLAGRRDAEVLKSKQAAEKAVAEVKATYIAELGALVTRIDAAREQAQTVERESSARINEATAKVKIAEVALAETTAKYQDVQTAYNALKAKLG